MALDSSIFPESSLINGNGNKEYNEIPTGNDSSDSDSGNSIFLTQADTLAPPRRKVRRRQQASSQFFCPTSLSESTDSESEEATTFCEPPNETDIRQTDIRQQPSTCINKKPQKRHVPKRDIHFPFLERYYGGTRLSLHQQQTLVNSSIGGFFQCMKNLTGKSKEPELSPDSDLSPLEEETENLDDQDNENDIRIVDKALFVHNVHKRNRQEWRSNTKKAPSEVKNTKNKLPNTKDGSKASKIAQSRRSKQSNPSKVKKTRSSLRTEDASNTSGTGPTRRSERLTVKRINAQNLAGSGSCSNIEEGSEMRGSDNPSVQGTSQNQKTASHVTSRPADASDVEDGQTDDDQTDTELNQLQTQPLSLESTECTPSQQIPEVARVSDSSGESVPVCAVTTDEVTSTLLQVTSNTACSEGTKRQPSEKPDTDCDTSTENVDPDAGLTLDNDGQSTAEPLASQPISNNLVFSENDQASPGDDNSTKLDKWTERQREQEKKRQNEISCDWHDKSGPGEEDSQNQQASQMTRNSPPSQELYKTGKCPDPVSEDEWNKSHDCSYTPSVQCVDLNTVPNIEDKEIDKEKDREIENGSSQDRVPNSTPDAETLSQKKKVDKDQTDTTEGQTDGQTDQPSDMTKKKDPVSEDEWNQSHDYSYTPPMQCVELSTVPNVEDKKEIENGSSQDRVPSSTLHSETLSQKRVDKDQTDTTEMLLQGINTLTDSESCGRLGQNETETHSDAVQEYEESQLQEHTECALIASEHHPKTQIQLEVENDGASSQAHEMHSVDGEDSSAKKKRKKKKKKHEKDCMELEVECSASGEIISISQDITPGSAPETEIEFSSQRKRRKHKHKKDSVQQDSQEQAEGQTEGQTDQPSDMTKKKDPVSVDEWNQSHDYSYTPPMQCVELSTIPSVEDKKEIENGSSQDMVPNSTPDAEKQKKKVDKDQTDTTEMILQGNNTLAESESCGRLGQNETETRSDAVQENEESQLQEHTECALGDSEPHPKTQIQLEVENDGASSQAHEMYSVDGDSCSAKKKRKKKKKKHEKDCMELVDECREIISISQDITLGSVPETEIEISSQRKRKKHKHKKDCVQQDSQEQAEGQTEGQTDQPSDIQLEVENDGASSHEMHSVDGDDSSAKKKQKKKKKKHEKDCMELEVECSASGEIISISQDITPGSAPETEIEISSQRKRRKHKHKKDRVQQDSQEQTNYQPEGQTDQPSDMTKKKKKLYNSPTYGQSPPVLSTVERVIDSQLSSSQVCEVSDFDGSSVTLNTSAKKKKRKKGMTSVMEEKASSHKDSSSFSPQNQVTFIQEAVPKKKKKKRKHDLEQCVLENGTNLVSDDQRLVQQTGTETQQAQISAEQSGKPSGGSESVVKRKEDLCDACPSNIVSTTDAKSEVLYKKKKKKKKKHKCENSSELGVTTEDNDSQDLREVQEGERPCPSSHCFEKEKDEVQVHPNEPEVHHAEQIESPIKKKRKKKRDPQLDTADVDPEESLCLSLVPHKKKKKKRRLDETSEINELKESDSGGLQSVVDETEIPDPTNVEQRLDDNGHALMNSEKEERRKKKRKSKH